MKVVLFSWLMAGSVICAGEARVLIDGTGCRTRQQAIERIFEKLPEVDRVTILPRRDSPADNQRIFVLQTNGDPPSKEELIAALGRRAKFYKVLSVE